MSLKDKGLDKTTSHDEHSYNTGGVSEEVKQLARNPEALSLAYSEGKSIYGQLTSSPFIMLCAFTAAVGGFSFGYDQGVISVILAMSQFLKVYPEVDTNASASASFNKGLMTAMLELGAFLGALQSGFTSDKFSRRRTLMIGVIWFLVGSILQTASSWYAMLVVGRLIGGVGVGTLAAVAPLYISELSPPNIRGTLLVSEGWMVQLGCAVSYYIAYGTKTMDGSWAFRLPFLLQMTPALFLAAVFIVLPYSPRWLVSQGREEEALATIAKVRNLSADDPRVQAEWYVIRAEAEVQQITQKERYSNLTSKPPSLARDLKLEAMQWIDSFRHKIYRRTHVGIGLGFFQQFLGINAMIYYGPSLFESVGLDSNMQLIMTGVMNVCQVVGGTPVFYLLDRAGRRTLVLIGSVAICASHSIIAALIGVYGTSWPQHQAEGWVATAFILLFMIIFGMTWSIVPWALPPEIFPSTFRAKGTAISTCTIWLGNFIVGLITPTLTEQQNGAGAFIFFAVFAFLSILWAFLFVPETKGRSLEDMDHLFHDNTSTKDAEQQDRILSLLFAADPNATPLAAVMHANEIPDDKKEKLHQQSDSLNVYTADA